VPLLRSDAIGRRSGHPTAKELDPPALAGAVSVSIVLAFIVSTAVVVHLVFASESPNPWVFPDELRYAELAKSIAGLGLPQIRGEVTFDFGPAYPVLIAPAWAIFDDPQPAYALAKIINVIVLSLTAIPSYFLARRFVASGRALGVAALAVSIPSLLYSGLLMTEVLLYPTFVLGLYGVVVALERPSVSNQLLTWVVIGFACAVKILALALGLAFLLAIGLLAALRSLSPKNGGVEFARYWPTALIVGAVGGAAIATSTAGGGGPLALFGIYEDRLRSVDWLETPWWIALHLAELDLFLVVTPFATTILVLVEAFRRDATVQAQVFAVTTLASTSMLLLAVGVYSSDSAPSPYGYATGAAANERATFVLAPLFFIGFVLWLEEWRRSHRKVVLALVVCVAAAAPALIPLELFAAPGNIVIQALALTPWWGAEEYVFWPVGVLVATALVSMAFLLGVRRNVSELALVAPVAVGLLAVTMISQTTLADSSRRARRVALPPNPTWVDDAVGPASHVSVLWYEPPGHLFAVNAERHRMLWFTEFFNRSVGTIFEIGTPIAYGRELPSVSVRLDADVVVARDGSPAQLGSLVLTPCHVKLDGKVIATDNFTGAKLYRISGTSRVRVRDPVSCAQGATAFGDGT
jgi:hypothetical protein